MNIKDIKEFFNSISDREVGKDQVSVFTHSFNVQRNNRRI